MKKASLSIIFATVFIDLLGFGILIPILPSFAGKVLHISDLGIGVLIATFSFMQFLFNPVLGNISDKYGRRPILVLTLLFTGTSYIIFGFSKSFWVLLFSRMLAGIGGSNIGVAQAYIADITTKDERSNGMGVIGAAFGLGFLFGPIIGGFLSKFGYLCVGLSAAGFSFSAFVFAAVFLPESIKEKSREPKFNLRFFDFGLALKILRHPVLGMLILTFFIIIFSIANIYGTFPILGYRQFGFSDRQIGYLYGVMGVVGTLVQGGVVKVLSGRVNDRTLVLWGSIWMMAGLIMIPYGGGLLMVALSIGVYSVGTSVLQPVVTSMISKYAPEHEQGSVLGLNQSISAFARVLGPLWGGFSFQFLGYRYPFLTGALFTFITIIITIFMLSSRFLTDNQKGN